MSHSEQPGRDRPLRILFVEDSASDVFFVEETFEDLDVPVELDVAKDGDLAVARLDELRDADALPDLVLLDINLPRRNGHEVLEHIRRDPKLRPLPVTMYTSSDADEDVHRAYAGGANAYHQKPNDLAGISTLFRTYLDYWVGRTVLPTPSSA